MMRTFEGDFTSFIASISKATAATAIALALVATSTTPASSQTAIRKGGTYITQNDGSKARVNLSSRLGSLAEDVAATSCRISADTMLDDDVRHLQTLTSTFETILSGLERGDDRLGIPSAETKVAVVKRIRDVRNAWRPIQEAANRLAADKATEADITVLSTAHRELGSLTKALASDVSGAYSNPVELLQTDALTLGFMGRQRDLATRFARATCGIYSGDLNIGSEGELLEAMQMYEMTYDALANGMPDAGIAPPPSDAVKVILDDSIATWRANKALFESDASTPEGVRQIADYAANSVRQTDNAITLYMVASPGQSDIFNKALESYTQDQLLAWLESPLVVESILDQNAAHADLTEVDVVALDDRWRAEADGTEGELIASTLANPLSVWLSGQATNTAGIVTEVFVMDNKGLNVGQSAQTSDFWQGDEAKWTETFGQESDDLHISDLEYDESTRSYQTQASKIIRDPETGEAIGAVTFGINVMNLM